MRAEHVLASGSKPDHLSSCRRHMLVHHRQSSAQEPMATLKVGASGSTPHRSMRLKARRPRAHWPACPQAPMVGA